MAFHVIASDGFPSSIDSGWTNAPGGWGAMSWTSTSGGCVQPTSNDSDASMVRASGTYPRDQWSAAVIDSVTGSYFAMAAVLVLQNSANRAAYWGAITRSPISDRYVIEETDASGNWTNLASGGGQFTGSWTAGTAIRLDMEDSSGHLRFYTDEGSGFTSRLTATDTTLTSGRPGLGGYGQNPDGVSRITSWEGGDHSLHEASGALSAGSATVAGTSAHEHASTGALAAAAATIAGSAAHLTLHDSSGALTAGDAEIAGDAEYAADGAFDAAGSLSAQAASVAGTAARLALHTSSGALAAQSATVAGAAVSPHLSTGAIAAAAAGVAGSAAHLALHTSSGALEAGAAAVSGAAVHEHAASGALAAGASAISGSAAHLALHESSGDLEAGAAEVAGDAAIESGAFDAAGSLSAQAAAVVGAATRFALHTSTGALAAGAAVVAGDAAHVALHASSGALAAGAAAVSGTASRLALHTSEGAIAAGPATVAGNAAHIAVHEASGDLEAQAATVSGSAILIAAGASTPAAIWNYVLSNGLTAEQNLVQNNEMLRIIMSGIAGQSSGVGTDTETYYGSDHTTPRIIATFDAAGNRVTVVTDGTP